MTAPLEARYRRLLAVYPAEHRRAYQEEMIGVLMAGARPGQRRPALGDAADLLRAGFLARLDRGRQAVRGRRGTGWRDAAAVTGLIGVVLLLGVATRRLGLALHYSALHDDALRAFGIDHGLLIDVAARAVAWLAVLIAVLLAAKRTAVVLGAVALLVEAAALVTGSIAYNQFHGLRMSWAPVLGLITVAFLVPARSGRPAKRILGGWGLAGLAGAAILTGGGAVVLGRFNVPGELRLVAGVLLLAALVPISRPVRRRAVVLLVPLAAVPVAQGWMETAIGIDHAPVVTPGMVLVDVLIMVGVPLMAWAVAVAALHAGEHFTVSVTRRPGAETV